MAEGESTVKKTRLGAMSIGTVLFLLVFLGFALLGDKGFLCAYKSNQYRNTLTEKVRQAEQLNGELRREIDALLNDPAYQEKVARQELGMVRGDELVYQFSSAR